MAGAGARAAQGRLSPARQAGPGLGRPRSLRSPPQSDTGRSKPLPGARRTSWPTPPRVPMDQPNLYPVKLYVYDLSKGLARRLSPIMLGEGAGAGGKAGRNGARRCQDGRPRWGGLDLGSQGDTGSRVEESPVTEGRDLRFGPLAPLSCLHV